MGGTRLLSLNVRLARAKDAVRIVTYERPLLAESGPSFDVISGGLNVRFREKRTLSLRLPKLNRKMSALPWRSQAQFEMQRIHKAA